MEPERGLIERLHDKGAADDDEAREEYDEHCRSIAGVDEAVIKPAHIAMGWQTEETTEQLTPTALRAPAHQPGKQRRHRRTGGLIRHDILAKQKRGDLGRPCPKAPAGWAERSETHLRPFSAVSPAMGFAQPILRVVDLNVRRPAPHRDPIHICRRTRRATRRQRSASTRRQIQTPDAAWARTARP